MSSDCERVASYELRLKIVRSDNGYEHDYDYDYDDGYDYDYDPRPSPPRSQPSCLIPPLRGLRPLASVLGPQASSLMSMTMSTIMIMIATVIMIMIMIMIIAQLGSSTLPRAPMEATSLSPSLLASGPDGALAAALRLGEPRTRTAFPSVRESRRGG